MYEASSILSCPLIVTSVHDALSTHFFQKQFWHLSWHIRKPNIFVGVIVLLRHYTWTSKASSSDLFDFVVHSLQSTHDHVSNSNLKLLWWRGLQPQIRSPRDTIKFEVLNFKIGSRGRASTSWSLLICWSSLSHNRRVSLSRTCIGSGFRSSDRSDRRGGWCWYTFACLVSDLGSTEFLCSVGSDGFQRLGYSLTG